MKRIISSLLFVASVFSTSACNSSVGFSEPATDAEWKAFCESPDYVNKLKEIENEEQRHKVAGTCLRAPWQKFKPSEQKKW